MSIMNEGVAFWIMNTKGPIVETAFSLVSFGPFVMNNC